ncbi:GntR family transcriptional regulator [Pseudonocardia xinjiangensis]|uniref:GntR family transcriptional regulator n=1 Tax=Pseudonocardia xinjiangensis TaxID=75289 RepID=A0ABX1RA94_9PSEU|nr:GntR family transcriptional regulator [Pseudonocardia xinjiangensis]NMH76701.1 GntR family transcriptional regulator [Pseudonocardia xinjiangensis]
MSTELLDRAPTLERRHGLPVHAQIEQWLMDEITHGQIATGDRLPGERALAAALRVSRMTLRQALDGLARRGVLVRLPGRTGGAFVAEPKIDCDLTGLAGFTEQMRRAHRRAGAEVLSARTVAAEETVAAALRMPPGTAVHELVRVRSADGTPLALERSWFPAEHLPGLLDHPLTGSIYDLLSLQFRLAPHTAVEYLESVSADAADADALGVPRGTALMSVERVAQSVAGLPVEFARDVYRADRVRLMVRTDIQERRRQHPGG